MKKLAYIVLAVALVALGWVIGRRATGKTAPTADQSSVASEVLKAQMFNSAFTEVAHTETVIEQLNAGRIDDAKQLLRTHQDGCIFALDNALDPTAISAEEMTGLRDLDASIQASHGSKREMANRILARIAQHRADHPWTYKGDLPHSVDAEVETRLASILKRANESQK